jgi:TonB family protein
MSYTGPYWTSDTLVGFYHSKCESCVKMVPLMNALAEHRKDLNLLAFTLDSARETEKFVASQGLTWPIVTDAGELAGEIGAKFPAIALFDPKGKLVQVTVGEIPAENSFGLDLWLNKLIAATQSAAEGVQHLPPVATVAQVKTCAAPIYPETELRAKHTGIVKLNLLINTDGHAKKSKIVESSGFSRLDQAAIGFFGRCRFNPAMSNGVPVESWSSVNYKWTIKED